MNKPLYWLRKPRPTAAPRLAIAGKQLAQPIADAMLPSKPALSAARVMNDFAVPTLFQCLTDDG